MNLRRAKRGVGTGGNARAAAALGAEAEGGTQPVGWAALLSRWLSYTAYERPYQPYFDQIRILFEFCLHSVRRNLEIEGTIQNLGKIRQHFENLFSFIFIFIFCTFDCRRNSFSIRANFDETLTSLKHRE